ncbi:MAG: hypothetical protein ACEPOW_14530 [Bacteroidales bacterium]
MGKEIRKLNRFTSLPILIDLLERKKIILIEPTNWDDRNDTLIIEAYKKKASVKKLFALCFTHENETIHHWKTFADGNSGCCIQFNGEKLIEILDSIAEISHGIVQYKNITEIDISRTEIKDIPFLKREPYKLESEYRVIWEGNGDMPVFEIPITLDIIEKITFGQQMPEPVFQSIKKMIETTYPEINSKINRSTVYENEKWIEKFEKIESTKAQQYI